MLRFARVGVPSCIKILPLVSSANEKHGSFKARSHLSIEWSKASFSIRFMYAQ